MNSSNTHQPALAPQPGCARFAALLPLLDDLDDETATQRNAELAALRAHLPTCDYCQALRAQYAALDGGLRRRYGPASVARSSHYSTERIMQQLPDHQTTSPTDAARPKPAPRRSATQPRNHAPSRRSVVSGALAIASVLVIFALALTLFATRAHEQATHDTQGVTSASFVGTPVASFANVQGAIVSVSMVSAHEGWALGETAKTQDGAHPTNEVTFYHYLNGSWNAVYVQVKEDFAHITPPTAGASAQSGAMIGRNGASALVRRATSENIGAFMGTISMSGPNDGWAVASSYVATVTLRYTNGVWSEVATGDIIASSIQAISPHSAWAVAIPKQGGIPSLYHFDGATWTPVTVPGVNIIGLVNFHIESERSGWAFVQVSSKPLQSVDGRSSANSDQWQENRFAILQFADGVWTQHATMQGPDVHGLNTFALTAPDEGWALGFRSPTGESKTTTQAPSQQVLFHYQNGRWNEVTLPAAQQRFLSLSQLTMLSPTEGWALGVEQNAYFGATVSGFERHTVMYHYTGGQWQRVALPQTGAPVDEVESLAFTSTNQGWAAGFSSAVPGSQTVQESDLLKSATPLLWTYQNGAWATYKR